MAEGPALILQALDRHIHLIRTQALRRGEISEALDAAVVPEILKDSYASARPRVEALLTELG